MSRAIIWRCFHCGEAFTDSQERHARDHFGPDCSATPVCLMREPGEYHVLRALRAAQAELAAYRAEDTELHRALHAMACDHQRALRQQEELGYERGLRDAGTSETQAAGRTLGSAPTDGTQVLVQDYEDDEPGLHLAQWMEIEGVFTGLVRSDGQGVSEGLWWPLPITPVPVNPPQPQAAGDGA